MKNFDQGKKIIKNIIQFLPNGPGVYKMLDDKNTIIYVGKAKNLPNRINSYISSSYLPIRTERMISSTKNLEFISTQNEAEALLLEANLIKKNQPRYHRHFDYPHRLCHSESEFLQTHIADQSNHSRDTGACPNQSQAI